MKGVLKIKLLKKYIQILFTAFAFLVININSVNANNNEYLIGQIDYLFLRPETPSTEISFSQPQDINKIIVETNNYSKNYVNYIFYDENNNIILSQNLGSKHDNHFIGQPVTIIDIGNDTKQYVSYKVNFENVSKIRIERIDNVNVIHENTKFYSLKPLSYKNISNLNYDINNNEITFNYDLPDDDNFSHLELHQDGLLLADNIDTNYFEVYNLEYDTKYNFTFYAVDKDGNKSNGIGREIALPSDPNLIPSNNIFGLTHSVSDTNVSFNYSLPLDNNFSHLKIYRNNELINDNYQLAEFIDTGLEPETEYNYRFVSVNKMDISNVGYAVTIKTMEENDTVPPAIPTGLNTTNMNSGIVLSWNTNTESDLQGYYVYMNGTKMNSKPITNTVYNITNLENGLDYSFTISAVDTFGNESEQSINVVGVPDVDNLPIFKLDTKLSSIGSSVENWFSEIWLIVAFATAIPLSFAIAGRVKGLFIA